MAARKTLVQTLANADLVDPAAADALVVSGDTLLFGQGAAVADATGGATVDAEARTALNALLAQLRTIGVIAT